MRTGARRKKGFTLMELVIVIGVITVLNGVGILFLLRYLEVQDKVSARAQLAVRSHLFLRHLREDVSLAERAPSSFKASAAGRDCLILEGGRAPDRRVILYQPENGQMRRKEYLQTGEDYVLTSDRSVLFEGRSACFSRDPQLPRLLWVGIEGPPPDRWTSQAFEERAALCLPFEPEETIR